MNNKSFIYLKKINIAKFFLFGCIFLFGLMFSNIKVSAKNDIKVIASTYAGNSKNTASVTFDQGTTNKADDIVYIQGTGESNKDGVKFEISNMYGIGEFTAFAVWETAFSSSAGEYADYDRWYLRAIPCSNLQSCTTELIRDSADGYVVRDSQNKIIYTQQNMTLYYLERSKANIVANDEDEDFVETKVDFSNFFINNTITYTYRLRNVDYINTGDGFGFKEVQINFWKSGQDTTVLPDDDITVKFGLARAISDVSSYTNHNNPTTIAIACSNHTDEICVDYADTNGTPSSATTVPKDANIYIPANVIYSHASTTRTQVIANYKNNKVDMQYVKNNNTLYAINYFCEANSINLPTISYSAKGEHSAACANGQLRQYVYVESALIGKDIDDGAHSFDTDLDEFVENPYQISLEVDSRGNYVVIIRDYFGNTNEITIIQVMDILNQAIIAYFEKSNKTNEVIELSNGWKANEYLTNGHVEVSITMTATTVINLGLPIIEADTTYLDKSQVRYIKFWRVESGFDDDVCSEGVKENCATRPNTTTTLYSSSGENSTPVTSDEYLRFNSNTITLKIESNGRYRFYIETFSGNNSEGTSEGESKNPRVEVYKIDRESPEITFSATYSENTYDYYKGTGNPSGTVVEKMPLANDVDFSIAYSKNSVYYAGANAANGGSSILESASDSDIFYNYLMALAHSQTKINENIKYYDASASLYSQFLVNKRADGVYAGRYTVSGPSVLAIDLETKLAADETAYREYIIENNIKYTAFSLASNPYLTLQNEASFGFEQNRINIEYLDAQESDITVCDKLSYTDIDFNGDETIDQTECVNYYLDHGIDFKIRLTVSDIVQTSDGTFVLGTSNTATIYVDVIDTTAPGFSKVISNYNVGSNCRLEIGNTLQSVTTFLECYGITTSGVYNQEDNVFKELYSRVQTVNKRANIEVYILNRETGKWTSLDDNYTPNRSGVYTILIVLNDDASTSTTFDLQGQTYNDITVAQGSAISVPGNAIALLTSYYVDKKIVLIEPLENEKTYGEEDPIFNYKVYANLNNTNIDVFLEAPFRDMSVFTQIGTTSIVDDEATLTAEALEMLFKGNNYNPSTRIGAQFAGILTRQESSLYNDYYRDAVSNDYVGLYKIVLGSLTISGSAADGYDIGEDYIIKIDPRVRNGEEYQLATNKGASFRRDEDYQKCNLVNSQIYDDVEVSGCYDFKSDDDFFVESTTIFTIKQTILQVNANGGTKVYGDSDPNFSAYNTNNKVESAGYLNGYTVSGLQYADTASVVRGVLRREVGEGVGIYAICNYRGDDESLLDTVLETTNNMLILGSSASQTVSSCGEFDGYNNTSIDPENGTYVDGILQINEDYIRSRALYIAANARMQYTKTLNVTTDARDNNHANYIINYIPNRFEISPATMIVQPTPGQRREYSFNGVDEVKPWEVIIYGAKSFTIYDGDNNFLGFTVDSADYTIVTTANDHQSQDLESDNEGEENYNNATEVRNEWKLIKDNITYLGFKTNVTNTLFEGGSLSLTGLSPVGGVYLNMNAGWYNFNDLTATGALSLDGNARLQCVYSNYKSEAGIEENYTDECRNYDLEIDLYYRNTEGYKNGDRDESGELVEVVYKSKLGYCRNTTLGATSDPDIQCSQAQAEEILFEVYRREIILEFNSLLEKIPSTNTDIVYGYRYDYYYEKLFEISTTSANRNFLENSLFYCYASYKDDLVGKSGGCSTNKWYGLTEGDSWANVGLEFHLHSTVSLSTSGYYSTDEDYALPAGRYYVYSSISEDAERNYKYNYLGGTLTIKTKAVGITLTDYAKEYGDVYYRNITCINDGSLLSGETTLISGCEDVSNSSTNTYGFTVIGLDSKDTIADNFTGRPIRESYALDADINGLQENVGIYKITIGNINSYNTTEFIKCNGNFLASEYNGCVMVDGVVINNYITSNGIEQEYSPTYELKYYLLKNGTVLNEKDYSSIPENIIVNSDQTTLDEATLTIRPATITITVTPGQTKMYGCAYNSVNTTSSYNYTYSSGYDCIETTGTNYDLGYEYTVVGDKDYYIYNNGYYDTNYDYNEFKENSDYVAYTSSAINMVNKNQVVSSLIKTGVSPTGLRSSALNGGVLYRVNSSLINSVTYANLISAATKAQKPEFYQAQKVGSYILTLGNLDASTNDSFDGYYNEENNKVCDATNMPTEDGNKVCKNYVIEYYGNKSTDTTHVYSSTDNADTTFTITPRVAFIYALYNSKVYGNPEPVVTKECTTTMITQGFCKNEEEEITYGLSEYHTKFNSLAKAPWVASIETTGISFATTTINDIQTDVVSGELSRIGMNGAAKNVDDVVGTYNYIFDDVVTTTYASNNYVLNYYYREVDGNSAITVLDGAVVNDFILDDNGEKQAVNPDGGNTQVVESETKNVVFEINLRKITITLISFSKVYGIEDDSQFYDLGICASGDQTLSYDSKGNPICTFNQGISKTDHGLSPTHKGMYVNADGTLKQSLFKEDFGVTFVRVLGENVACPTGNIITGTAYGFFANKATSYDYELDCSNNGYEALGLINQASSNPGYNYEVTYVKGTMNILPRTILITPKSNQGFQYGSYTSPSLIPAIKFDNELKDGEYYDSTKKVVAYDSATDKVVVIDRANDKTTLNISTIALGLVNGADEGRVCLKNIDGTSEFCINDRQDTYDSGLSEKTTSSYTYNSDGVDSSTITYVFGDVYNDEATSIRKALNRKIDGSNADERYNRNVGTYEITLGDLVDENNNDKTGNYVIEFTPGVNYTITPAKLKITPEANQSKVYGEADVELVFSVETTYKVNNDQYVTYNDSIISITEEDGTSISITGEKIHVSAGSTIVLSGYAYYENINSANYNYGTIKNSNKSNTGVSVSQSDVIGNSFDKYCYNSLEGAAIDGCSNRTVQFSSTSLVLVGYLYIEGYNQKAGIHNIKNGFVVADNEFDYKNYVIDQYVEETFEIIKLDINLSFVDVTKTYGVSTDAYKCDTGIDCTSDFALLGANDHENRLEYNFNISYKFDTEYIGLTDDKVLMVNAIGGNYYTQSEGQEDKNNFLGITVVRKDNNDTTCTVSTDVFGCEDVGNYELVFRKFEVTGQIKDGSARYDDNYNLLYADEAIIINEVDNAYIVVDLSNNGVSEISKINVITNDFDNIKGTLTINKREIDIFVNTNLNITTDNFYEIQQNVMPPRLPTINNEYNLKGYEYIASNGYHGIGVNASSRSENPDLDSTYTQIVWGGQPTQVRTQDALVGEVAYCNEATNGNLYLNMYPGLYDATCTSSKLVYNENKNTVNTNTKDKFIVITRDTSSTKGLKIMATSTSAKVANNDYEEKNYSVKFYPGAVHVIEDTNDPTLIIGNKDYYIEANAKVDGATTVGSLSSIGTILQYLFNGGDTKLFVLAQVDENGNMYITINNTKIDITQASLESVYGVGSESYPGIVSGVEQAGILPFVSDYAHTYGGSNPTYVDESNIGSLQELITTFVKWFEVTSYDRGQYINGQYLERKFDKYYYMAINKNGYDVAGDINNEFEINKVATYTVSFYVMDNAGRVSGDGNFARLHIIDTTKPTSGELTLYNTAVACDSGCNLKDQWYILGQQVKLSAFNRYTLNPSGEYVLDSAGEYILFDELGSDSPYKSLESLQDKIFVEDYVQYISINDGIKYSAEGVIHYTWSSNPTGVYLTITGGGDNSYTREDDSYNTQWKYYYSIDGGMYWLEYTITDNMVAPVALSNDGYRTIKIRTIDSGIDIEESNTTYTITYNSCYQGCESITIPNKVNIDGSIKTFTQSNVTNRTFAYDDGTICEINALGTLITCTIPGASGDTIERISLHGNNFRFNGITYTLSGNNVLDPSGGAFKLNGPTVTFDGIDYLYDSSSMKLYRHHVAQLGMINQDDGSQELIIDGETYVIKGLNVYKDGTDTGIDIVDYSFELNGLVYNYIEDASSVNGYYLAITEYEIYQDTFFIGITQYNISSFVGGSLMLNNDELRLSQVTNYENTYTLYDKYLLGLSQNFTDNVGFSDEDERIASIKFRTRITNNVAWNKANTDSTGTTNPQVSNYLNKDESTKYYKDSKVAYLDTTAPIIGINISTTVGSETINVSYGDDWYVYEYGYYNLMNLAQVTPDILTYRIRGVIYTINMQSMRVTDSNSNSYPISETGSGDTSETYVYTIKFTNYYINSEKSQIKWLHGYVEKYVGGIDRPKQNTSYSTETRYYNLNTSIILGGIDDSTPNESRLIENATTVTNSSGIGSNKYKTTGMSSTLFDFVYLGEYQDGIYYEDIDYIVWYEEDGEDKQVNLSEQFKACYLNDGKITQSCAQKAIEEVVKSPETNEDIVYTINYIVRDKAGNASTYAARGVIYATIQPSTNLIINNIEQTPDNSPVVVEDLGNDTYSMSANQGVSLQLLQEAFQVSYSSYGKNYNTAAVMTIYKNDELVVEKVKGLSFIDYINNEDVADYKIIYTMNSTYKTYLGQSIEVSGKPVTLYLSIGTPEILEDSKINLNEAIKTDSTYLLITVLVGMISIVGVGILFIKKRR